MKGKEDVKRMVKEKESVKEMNESKRMNDDREEKVKVEKKIEKMLKEREKKIVSDSMKVLIEYLENKVEDGVIVSKMLREEDIIEKGNSIRKMEIEIVKGYEYLNVKIDMEDVYGYEEERLWGINDVMEIKIEEVLDDLVMYLDDLGYGLGKDIERVRRMIGCVVYLKLNEGKRRCFDGKCEECYWMK